MKMAGELASLIKPQVRGNNTREGRNFDFDFFFSISELFFWFIIVIVNEKKEYHLSTISFNQNW